MRRLRRAEGQVVASSLRGAVVNWVKRFGREGSCSDYCCRYAVGP